MVNVRLENQGNSDWGKVVLDYHDKKHRFPFHIPSREIFNDDFDLLIRVKCVGLIGLTPLFSLLRSVYWLTLSIFMVFSEIYRFLDVQTSSRNALKEIGETAFESLRALGYGVLMTGNALKGVFLPYQGRRDYGLCERELHYHPDGPHSNKFYLAFCFQRLCVLSKDDKNIDKVEEKLTRYVSWIDAIRADLCSCDFKQFMVDLRSMRLAKP